MCVCTFVCACSNIAVMSMAGIRVELDNHNKKRMYVDMHTYCIQRAEKSMRNLCPCVAVYRRRLSACVNTGEDSVVYRFSVSVGE